MAQSSRGADFSLDTFRNQLQKFAKPGMMQKLIELLPGKSQTSELMGKAETIRATWRLIGIINSMTPQERRSPKIIEPGRQKRIARGAGVPPQEVHRLVMQYVIMKPLMDGDGPGDVTCR